MYIDYHKMEKAGFAITATEDGIEIHSANPRDISREIEKLTELRERDIDEVCCLISSLQIIAAIKSY